MFIWGAIAGEAANRKMGKWQIRTGRRRAWIEFSIRHATFAVFHVRYDLAMPTTPHIEKHFKATESVRDVVIGMSDGLTVPFALAAGLSGAVAATSLIVTAGLAETAAGA